jgi:hypothetical protein
MYSVSRQVKGEVLLVWADIVWFVEQRLAGGIFSNQGTEPTFVEPRVYCLFSQQSWLEKVWLKKEEGLVYS